MNRYAAVAERIAKGIDPQLPGSCAILVAPGEQAVVAQALASFLPSFSVGPLDAADLESGAGHRIVPGLPAEPSAILGTLNQRRGWLAARGRVLILVLSQREFSETRTHAGDTVSALLFSERILFIPDPAIQVEEAQARRELARWQRERLGRLDLRGFIRTETEDASWRVEDLYQEMKGTPELWMGHKDGPKPTPVIETLARACNASKPWPVVVLGHPGAGKSFFLRWLALNAAENDRFFEIDRPVPLLVSLAAFTQTTLDGLLPYFIEQLLEARQPIAHVLTRLVDEGRVIFLLDGLDEVSGDIAIRRARNAIHYLRAEAEHCLTVVSSRLSGYSSLGEDVWQVCLAPFDDDAIREFLRSWCVLYARSRLGDTQHARESGESDGKTLATEVLSNDAVKGLATNPLLLTVLAIVHRTGVRLPDHRVELYDHATRVLVERWNGVRSLDGPRPEAPIRVADAVRLLGPVALEMIQTGSRGSISEDRLKELLTNAMASGNLRGLGSPDRALDLFRNSLGLLVEQAPHQYAFLHLTFVEYLAARELIRSGKLDDLSRDSERAFLPAWREVLLLAMGELGIVRADDRALAGIIGNLLKGVGSPSTTSGVGASILFCALLKDDPELDTDSTNQLLDAMIPRLWFGLSYNLVELIGILDSIASLFFKTPDGQIRNEIAARIRTTFTPEEFGALLRLPVRHGRNVLLRLSAALLLQFILMGANVDQSDVEWGVLQALGLVVADQGKPSQNIMVDLQFDQMARKSADEIGFEIRRVKSTDVVLAAGRWSDLEAVGNPSSSHVSLRVPLMNHEADEPVWFLAVKRSPAD